MLLDSNELLLLLFIALGSYIQTTTGFAFGLIVIGSVTALNLVSIEITAFLISVLSLVNSIIGLRHGQWRHINRTALTWIVLPCIPATFIGIALLDYLGDNLWWLLKLCLGLFIILSSLSMLLSRKEHRESHCISFAFGGLFAGLIGGMFATFGPPVSYLMYRQPNSITVIRATLLAIFSITACVRILLVSTTQQVSDEAIYLSIVALPVVVIATTLAQRIKLPFSNSFIRNFAFVLLLVSGVSLVASSIPFFFN